MIRGLVMIVEIAYLTVNVIRMAELYFDYGFGKEGLGGRIYHGEKLVIFTPDPELFEKHSKYKDRKIK